MYCFIILSFLISGLNGAIKLDKILLFNSNTYYGTFIKSTNEKVFFKISGNTEADSVDIVNIQLLQLSSGNKIIDNGVIVGKSSFHFFPVSEFMVTGEVEPNGLPNGDAHITANLFKSTP